MGLLYYLFAAHDWPLSELRALYTGGSGWHDLILAMSSFEVTRRT